MAQWARSISGFSLVLFLCAGIGHRYGLVETVAFFWLLGLVAALALIGLALAAWGFHRLWEHGEKAGRASLAAALMSLAVLSPYATGAVFVMIHPALTDISTDLQEPPQFVLTPATRTGQMNPIAPISPEAAREQRRHYPQLSGRRYDGSPERVLSALEAVLDAHGWTPRRRLPATVTASEFSFEAQAPTFLLRFPSDAAIRLTDEGESVFVDMRLNARYGRHDMGDGARRIAGFMAALDAEFARQSMEIIDIPASGGEEDPVE